MSTHKTDASDLVTDVARNLGDRPNLTLNVISICSAMFSAST